VESFIETNFDVVDGGAKATAPVTKRRILAHRFIIMVSALLMLQYCQIVEAVLQK
jgi:hypothetical protein